MTTTPVTAAAVADAMSKVNRILDQVVANAAIALAALDPVSAFGSLGSHIADNMSDEDAKLILTAAAIRIAQTQTGDGR